MRTRPFGSSLASGGWDAPTFGCRVLISSHRIAREGSSDDSTVAPSG